jgi:PQQ-dependent catabolism-associated CXXCW motif protein
MAAGQPPKARCWRNLLNHPLAARPVMATPRSFAPLSGRRLAAVLCFVLIGVLAHARAGEAPPEPATYRQRDYRAPTPATLKGARVLTTEEAAALWRAGEAAFIDVLPQAPRPAGLPADVVWREKPHYDIPGSVWLPDTGYGERTPVMLDYFERGLDKASGGRSRPVVF